MEAARAHLRACIAEPLEPPADWRRASAVGGDCPHCRALSRFLADPTAPTWSLRAVQADRSHVESRIRTDRCDVDTETLRKGSPHTLVCTKNRASYERRVAQRREDVANLVRLEG
ncbi:hypothetical protein [Azospirillum sp. ST 5-10]|uniref:hypothetical protein n=1 Tax=unclassified Azospirillum TaxID=2630922 RepID=UPI003F4A1554